MLALETPTLLTLFLNTQISRQATGLIKNCTIQYSYMAVDACIKLPLIRGPTEHSNEVYMIML